MRVREVDMALTHGTIPGHAISSTPRLPLWGEGKWPKQTRFPLIIQKARVIGNQLKPKTSGYTVAISRTNRSHSIGKANLHIASTLSQKATGKNSLERLVSSFEGLSQCPH